MVDKRPPPPQAAIAAVESEADEDESYIDYFYDEPGSAPGTLNIEEDAVPTQIFLIDYNQENATRIRIHEPTKCHEYLDTESVSWVDVQGLGNQTILQEVGEVFKLHPLILEDVVNVPQRPKVEEHADQLVIIVRMVTLVEDEGRDAKFISEQVSLVLGHHYLLTVQEEPKYDCFNPVRDRIRHQRGVIRSQNADYLAYSLIDAVIDGFFPVLETYGERIELLEDEVVANPCRETLGKIYQVRRELLSLRRSIWPQRSALNSLIRDGSDLISPEVQIYLRDCYDHVIQVLDVLETYRELASSLMDVYLSSVGNRMNEVMKLLTVISTIFIPLTFIAGVYGMNFNPNTSPWNMPELTWRWGYPLCWAIMLAIAAALVYFFWRRGWFQDFSAVRDE